jgi:hypothetical protein
MASKPKKPSTTRLRDITIAINIIPMVVGNLINLKLM